MSVLPVREIITPFVHTDVKEERQLYEGRYTSKSPKPTINSNIYEWVLPFCTTTLHQPISSYVHITSFTTAKSSSL